MKSCFWNKIFFRIQFNLGILNFTCLYPTRVLISHQYFFSKDTASFTVSEWFSFEKSLMQASMLHTSITGCTPLHTCLTHSTTAWYVQWWRMFPHSSCEHVRVGLSPQFFLLSHFRLVIHNTEIAVWTRWALSVTPVLCMRLHNSAKSGFSVKWKHTKTENYINVSTHKS